MLLSTKVAMKPFLFVLALLLPSFAQAESISEPSNLSFQVMSYNIQQMGFPSWFGRHYEQQRLEKLSPRILEMDPLPDVIVFQEAFITSAHQHIVESLKEVFPYATQIGGETCSTEGWSSEATNCELDSVRHQLTHNSGVFILSRWPIEASHSLTYKNYRVSYTFDFMARKGAVYARINKDGNLFHVVGTHLQADRASHDIRMAQLDEMKTWLDAFEISKQEAVILAGDFNVDSRNLIQSGNMLSHANAWVYMNKDDEGSVSSASNRYLNLIYGDVEEKTLDYILYRVDHLNPLGVAELKVLDFKSSTPWSTDSWFFEDQDIYDISDHYPVMLTYYF